MENNNYILFSPVGGHDPIASGHDGSTLHIFRMYRPKKTYLYLSQEMIIRSDKDNRYVESLRRCMELEGFESEIELIKKADLTDVHLFDTFYREFEPIIKKIQAENPDCTLLLNVSSGTPAMKSAIEIISALSPGNLKAVQVSVPLRPGAVRAQLPDDFDMDAAWSTNEDNSSERINRCVEIKSPNLLFKIKKESLIDVIHSRNYSLALHLAKEIERSITPTGMRMIEAAYYRSQLELSACSRISEFMRFDFLPVKDANIRYIFEYILTLDNKLINADYSGFVRAMLPLIPYVLDIYIKGKYGIDIKNEYYSQSRGGRYLPSPGKMDKLSRDRGRQQIKDLIMSTGPDPLKKPFSSDILVRAVKCISDNRVDIDIAEKLRNVEIRLKSAAFRGIEPISEEVILAKCGMSCEEILTLLKSLVEKSGYGVQKEDWISYNIMDKTIEENL